MRKETKIYKLVGIKDGCIFMIDYLFKYGKGFKGATGTCFEVITKERLAELQDYRYENDYCEELWRSAVNAKQTLQGLDSFIDDYKANMNEDFVGQDNSYVAEAKDLIDALPKEDQQKIEELLGGMATLNCVGGGRCFSYGEKYDHVFDAALVGLINKYERPYKAA